MPDGNYAHTRSFESWDAYEKYLETGSRSRFPSLHEEHVVVWDWHRYPEAREWVTLGFYSRFELKAVRVYVEPTDEPRVRAYLKREWAKLRKMWAPISGEQALDYDPIMPFSQPLIASKPRPHKRKSLG